MPASSRRVTAVGRRLFRDCEAKLKEQLQMAESCQITSISWPAPQAGHLHNDRGDHVGIGHG
jgi:hypothetical protein